MAKDLLIRLEAKDNASAVFQRTGRAGREMGEEIDRGAEQAADALDDMERAQEEVGQSAVDMVLDVGRAADEIGRELPAGADRAGRALDELDRAQDQVGQSASEMGRDVETASRSLKDFEDAGKQVGAGLALLGTSFSMYASQLVDYERNVAALGRTYGDAAGQFVALADTIQNTTIFSNDEAVQAANILGTLKRNYELTNEQIQQLIMTSADLAAVNGTTLTDAAQRVAASIRGEGESIEALGLTMNQTAIDAEGLTLSMSNAEAGQFRFNALMEQSTFALGAASDATENAAGKTQQFANRLQDTITGFVEMTGPVGQAAGVISSFGLEAGLALSGTVALAKGMREATSAAGGFGAAIRSGTGLMGVLGRAGIAGALVGAGVAAVELSGIMEDDLANALGRAEANVSTLDLTIAQLTMTMNNATLGLNLREGNAQLEEQLATLGEYKAALDELDRLRNAPPSGIPGTDPRFAEWEAQVAAAEARVAEYGQTWGDVGEAIDDAEGAQKAMLAVMQYAGPGQAAALQTVSNLVDMYEAGELTLDGFRNALDGVVADLGNYDTQALQAAAATEAHNAALQAGTGAMLANGNVVRDSEEALHQWAEAVSYGNTSIEEQTVAVEENTEAVIANNNAKLSNGNVVRDSEEAMHQWAEAVSYGNTSVETGTDAVIALSAALTAGRAALAGWVTDQLALNETLTGFAAAWADLDGILRGSDAFDRVQQLNFEDEITDTRSALRPYADALYETASATTELVNRTQDVPPALANVESAARSQVDVFGQYEDALAGVAEQFGLVSTNARLFQAAGIKAPSLDVAVNLQGGQDALDSVFGTIVGQTNAMSQQLGSVESWADKLIGDPGTWSQLDQLLADGRISLEQYNAAQDAQIRISRDVENAQQDLLAVQAGLAPVIADATRQQAEYIDGLQDLGPDAQLAALGFMDQAQSAKALEVAQLAAASATEGQREATTKMVNEMANADPVLAAMLVQMGLISEVKPGVYEVNFDDAVSATTAIQELNTTIEALADLLGEIFNVDTDTDAATTQVAVELLTGAIEGVPKNVTTYFNAVDNVSLTAGEISDILANLDGRTVTTYVNTVQTGGLALNNPFATGGTIPANGQRVLDGVPAFAGGGTLALVGEAGPELVRLPTGAQVTSNPASRTVLANVAQRGDAGVVFNGPVTLSVQRDGTAQEAIRRAALARARGY
jgi:hypothetical protein